MSDLLEMSKLINYTNTDLKLTDFLSNCLTDSMCLWVKLWLTEGISAVSE